jgi:hypothetical protein
MFNLCQCDGIGGFTVLGFVEFLNLGSEVIALDVKSSLLLCVLGVGNWVED